MEESTDVISEITPEMFDGEQETPKAESSPVEEVKVEAKADTKTENPEAEPKDEAKAEPEAKEEAKPDEAEKPEDKVEPEKPLVKAEERKAQLNAEIRDLVSQRNAIRAEVEKTNAEVYQVETEDELVDKGLSATEAKVEALRQELVMRDYNEKVAEAQLTISHESERVLKDFPIFDQDSDQYEKELAEEAAILLEANLIKDQHTGQIIGSNISPYQLYKTLARASGISATKGQLKGQQDTEQMLANADIGSAAAPPKQKTNPLDDLWAEPL